MRIGIRVVASRPEQPCATPEPSSDGAPPGERVALGRELRELVSFFGERLRSSPVTLTLIGTCVLLYCLRCRWGPGHWQYLASWHMGELRWSNVLDGELYRVFPGTFLHADASHLVGNMRLLLISGLLLEPLLGARRTILLYTACALGAGLCWLPTGLDTRILGASGAIKGLLLAHVGYRMRLLRPLPLGVSARVHGAIQLCVLFVGGWLPFAALARSRAVFGAALLIGILQEVLPPRNLGHLGGAVAGLLLSYTLLIRPRHLARENGERFSFSLVSVAAAVTSAAVVSSIAIAIAVGQPWRLRDPPALTTARLSQTPFIVTSPALAEPRLGKTSRGFHVFRYGYPFSSPVCLTIMVSTERLSFSSGEYAELTHEMELKRELVDDERRRSVVRTLVGAFPAVRIDSEREGLVQTTVQLSVDGVTVWIVGHREHWAARAAPPVWDGIEARIAASLRVADE